MSIQYVDYETAKKLVYIDKIVQMHELLHYLDKTNQLSVDVVKKHNPKIVSETGSVNLKIGEEKNGKRKMVCIGHPTSKDNSTNILVSSNKISCFRGGCICSNGLNVVQVMLIYRFKVDPKIVLNPNAYKTIGKEIFRSVAELLEMKGYKIIHTKQSKRLTREQKEQMINQEILNKSVHLYHQEFFENEKGREYFMEAEYEEKNKKGEVVRKKGRAFKYVAGEKYALEIVKRFMVGCAPETFPSTWLYDQLAPDFTTEELLRTSVVKWVEFKDENDKVYEAKPLDFHSDAIILPYWKGKNAFNIYSRGIDAPKDWRHLRLAGSVDIPVHFEEATKHEVVNIVEGEMTWLTKIFFGYENTLGNRGTNGLMPEHVKMLVQVREESGGAYCKTIVLAFDGDVPGREATLKTGEMLIKEGFDVRVVIMPDGMDHNDLLVKYKEKAKAVYEKIYSESVSFYTFVALAKIKEQTDSTADLLVKMAEVKQILVENGVVNEAELYLIAKEFSDVSHIPIDTIWSSWKKENKNVEAFNTQNFVFVTNDIESYYLLKFAFQQKAAYIEDVSFSCIQGEVVSKNVVADRSKYSEKELQQIEQFCLENEVRFLTFSDLSEVVEVKIDNAALINQMLKN